MKRVMELPTVGFQYRASDGVWGPTAVVRFHARHLVTCSVRGGPPADVVRGRCRQGRPVWSHRRDILAGHAADVGCWKVGQGVAGRGIWVILTRRSLRASQTRGPALLQAAQMSAGRSPTEGRFSINEWRIGRPNVCFCGWRGFFVLACQLPLPLTGLIWIKIPFCPSNR